MRRALAALLLLVAAVVPPVMADDLPVPQEPHQIFYVQRSLNPNTIVYTARLNDKGELDPKHPVDVFWRRYNDDGERKDLTLVESKLAFGIGGTSILIVVSVTMDTVAPRSMDVRTRLMLTWSGKRGP